MSVILNILLLTLKVKLQPTQEQRESLFRTMERFNAACNRISKAAFSSKIYNKVKLQHFLYYDIRKDYGLSAQLAIRAIAKVVESYKVERAVLHEFDEHGAIVYDQRILSLIGLDKASFNNVDGRIIIPMLMGAYAKVDERRIKGQADLIYVKGEFYLCIVVDVPEESPITPEGYLGVDLGIVNIASTSDGVKYTGESCDKTRTRYSKLKAGLQSCGTKDSKKRLKNHIRSRTKVQDQYQSSNIKGNRSDC